MRHSFLLPLLAGIVACSGQSNETDTDATGPVDDGVLTFDELVNVTDAPVGDLECHTPGTDWLVQTVDTEKQALTAAQVRVIDFQDDDPVAEATAKFWYADDVSTAADASGVTDADGLVNVDLPACQPMSYLTYTNPDLEATRDTYEAHQIFEPATGSLIEGDINSVSTVTYKLIPSMLGISPASDKGVIAGTAYDCSNHPVENGQIVVRDADGNIPQSLIVRYFVDEFPNRDQPATSADGLWVAINVPEGTWYADLYVAGSDGPQLIGTTVVQSFPESINISNIYTGFGEGVKYPESCLVSAE
jgi:hypothetical protein